MSQHTPIAEKDGSDICVGVSQYMIEKRVQEINDKSLEIKVDDAALPQTGSQPPPLLPSTDGRVPLEAIKDLYRAKWRKDQEDYKDRVIGQADPEKRWDKDGFPICKKGHKVAIIGAGVAGLRTAMLLQSRRIPYKIFEASGRAGGRLFTYKFPSEPPNNPQGQHDYYDAGGMRFPHNNANKETFELFEELDLTTIPYHFSNDNNIRYYNDIASTEGGIKSLQDHFGDREFVPEKYLNKEFINPYGTKYYGAEACASEAFEPFRKDLIADSKEGWEKLMKYDWASTRSYLAQGMNPTNNSDLEPNYPLPVVHWMETMNTGTGGYDQAFSEAILDSLIFDDPTKTVDWHALEGGSEVLTEKMLDGLDTKPSYDHRVTAIKQEKSTLMRVSVSGKKDELFTHVVSTTTFANLRNINTKNVPMTYRQRQAIRTLHYGPAVKVAIKFKTRWWEKNGLNQQGGSSHSDRQSRVVVYPSYGIGEDGPGVLMVAYNWHQDASRFGALIERSDWSQKFDPGRTPPPSEKVLLDQIYDNLAAMHGVKESVLRADTLDYHAFDWYHNPHTMGAFAAFAPGQFSTFFPDIVQTAGNGRFHFAGEVASPLHAWVAGALDSAKRAVAEILRLDFNFLIPDYREKYGLSFSFSKEEFSEERFLTGVLAEQLEEALKAAQLEEDLEAAQLEEGLEKPQPY